MALDLARWQFGIITVYHFLFVPLTIGLSLLVAVMQTAWVRTGGERWLRMTKFWGKLFLINFAMGVVTGIVQEFQFGMNWSDYSRFVGDVFGAPLAIEGLLAFFLESTFLGLWIFGWDRLPKRVHLATIWLAAIGTVLSALLTRPSGAGKSTVLAAVLRTLARRRRDRGGHARPDRTRGHPPARRVPGPAVDRGGAGCSSMGPESGRRRRRVTFPPIIGGLVTGRPRSSRSGGWGGAPR